MKGTGGLRHGFGGRVDAPECNDVLFCCLMFSKTGSRRRIIQRSLGSVLRRKMGNGLRL